MTRRITVGLAAALALALTACEVNVDYDLLLNADASSELQVDLVYDEEASQMLGPPEAFVDEVEMDTGGDTPGVRVIGSSADGSDPDAQRVSMTFAADDETALDALLRDSFDGSFTVQDGDVYELYLRAEDASMDGEMDLGTDFMSGSMVVRHDGQRESMSGGEEVEDQTVNWDPFGPQDLRLVVDLGAGGSAGGFAFGLGGGMLLLVILLGLLALVVVGLIVFLVVRRGKGGERAPAAGPMTGPMAGEVDAMQTPPAAGAAWGGHPQQAPPGNWDQQAQPSAPGDWDQPVQPAPQEPDPSQPAPQEPSGDREQPDQPPQPTQPPPGSRDPSQAPRPPEDGPDREPPPPGP